MMNRASKWVSLLLLAASAVAAWASWQLDVWSFMGPGPGLFPLMVSGLCLVLAAVVLLTPTRTVPAEDEAGHEPLAPAERRTFALYSASLVALAVGVTWLGLFLTCMLLSLMVIWFGERGSLKAALLTGSTMGLVGVVLFGWVLNVEIPKSFPEALIYQLLRS